MEREDRPEIEALVEELFARNGVLETMQSQIVLMLCGLTDDPAASVQMTMADVLTNLRGALAAAEAANDPVEARMARRAVDYGEDLAERLIATRRHNGSKTTQ